MVIIGAKVSTASSAVYQGKKANAEALGTNNRDGAPLVDADLSIYISRICASTVSAKPTTALRRVSILSNARA
jgi:hypothetical protein